MVAGQHVAIDEIADGFAGKQASRWKPGNRDKLQRRPVSQEQSNGGQQLVARPRMQDDQGRKKIAEADPP